LGLVKRGLSVIELLQLKTPKLLRPDLLSDLNPVDSRIWDVMQDRVYQMPVQDVVNWGSAWLTLEMPCHKSLWMTYSFIHLLLIESTDEWSNRLQACVDEKRSHFEYLLW